MIRILRPNKQFLRKKIEFKKVSKLPIESAVLSTIGCRLAEAKNTLEIEQHLSAVLLWGSVLEAVPLEKAANEP